MYNRKPTNRPKQSVGTQEATWSSGSLTTRVSVIVNCGSSLIFALNFSLKFSTPCLLFLRSCAFVPNRCDEETEEPVLPGVDDVVRDGGPPEITEPWRNTRPPCSACVCDGVVEMFCIVCSSSPRLGSCSRIGAYTLLMPTGLLVEGTQSILAWTRQPILAIRWD